MTSLGAVFLPQQPPERLRSVAQAADRSGLTQLWLWEDCFLQSGIASAAAALGWTDRLQVGIGLMPVPLRNVALTAMEIATLNRLFPDRVRTAVGHGVQDWMAQVGAKVDSPLALLREYVVGLRSLLAGETVTTQGRYVQLQEVTLEWPPQTAPPIFAGAVGARSLELSGEVADGTILTGGSTPQAVRAARDLIGRGRTRAGRSDKHEVIVYLIAATGADAADRLVREYDVWGLNPSDDVGVAGDARDVADAVQRWVAAGADTVILQPTRDDPSPEAFVEFVAQDVQPLVR